MDSLTLSTGRVVTFTVVDADFATREELYSFAAANGSTRGWAALVAEFARRHHAVRGAMRLTSHALRTSQSAFVLGGLAWEALEKDKWLRHEINEAGVKIFVALGDARPRAAEVDLREGFSEASAETGTSGPTP